VRQRKALVSGAAIRFDGQLMVFDLAQPASPCYACVFPEGGEGEELRCAVTGVLAPLTGIIGAMQAMEAIKLVAGAGVPVDGLLIFDAKTTGWRAVRARKDPACPVCSVQ
jgi:adenylyltransferase/sulfurtransferase